MMTINKIQAKIDMFLSQEANSQYRLYREEALIDVLFEKNIITKEELEIIRSCKSIFSNNIPANFSFNNSTEIFGGFFTQQPQKEETATDRLKAVIKTLDLFTETDGVIDDGPITVDKILNKYGAKNCEISKSEDGDNTYVEVTNPSCCFRIENSTNSVYITTPTEGLEIVNNIIETYSETKIDGHTQQDTEYSYSGKIKYKHSYSDDDDSTRTFYINGCPYRQINLKKRIDRNFLVEDLISNLSGNPINITKNCNELVNIILERITDENRNEVLCQYEEATGKNLIESIRNKFGLNKESKQKLIEHLEKGEDPHNIARSLAENIYGLGSGSLEKNIKKLNKDNIQEVLRLYGMQAIRKENEYYEKFKIPFTKELYFVSYKVLDFFNGGYAVGLIKSINDEVGLSQSKRKELIEHIINTVVEAIEQDKYFWADDIKKDILEHKDDIIKLDVDITRYGGRFDAQGKALNIVKPNGKIDENFKQYGFGDCWLISVLDSIIIKPFGRKFLESLLKVDHDNCCVEVTLPGVNKKYQIPFENIENSPIAVEGDGDIRAIELAVDQYIKELAYMNSEIAADKYGKKVDINGNLSTFAFKLFFGNGSEVSPEDADWNNENTCYTVGAKSSTNKLLKDNHAYAILKADNDYLYVFDPNSNMQINNIKDYQIIKYPISDVGDLDIREGRYFG